MSDSQQPFSNNPYAPKIPFDLYFEEKANFAGILIGAILYGAQKAPTVHLSVLISLVRFISGIVIVLFFHCLSALLSRVHRRREGTKWGLVAYTMVMFAFVTVFTAMNLNVQSDSYIDNREYPGDGDTLPPGPIGYQALIYSDALTIIPNLMFLLNNWMADGLLVSLFDSA